MSKIILFDILKNHNTPTILYATKKIIENDKTDEELNRPNIEDCFDKKATLEDVQKEYDRSPILFKYLVQLDLYIDKLEEEPNIGEDYEL